MPSEYQIHGQTQYDWTDPSAAVKNLHLNTKVPKPTNIPAGHALVRIRAAALNARDNMVIAHSPLYPGPHIQDLVPCADGAGEVVSIGQGSQWQVGNRVVIGVGAWEEWNYLGQAEMPPFETLKPKGAVNFHGTLREYAVIPDEELIKAPKHLSFEELAALPAAGTTAFHALFRGPRPLKAGQTVLAQGTGGVSAFVIQLAAAIGATVIATSSSEQKLKEAERLGAKHTINYREYPAWEEEVLKLTNGKGVDAVIEVAGSSTIEQSLKATKAGGVISLVGFLTETKATDLVTSIIFSGTTLYGVRMFTNEMTKGLVEFVEEKGIHPAIGQVFEWEDAKSAFELMGKQSVVGKIVVRVGGED
ncbi:NAD(P)-binding protein [Dendryphion nanum]|uniref:NAD(P)-binding protein n=1 Tax=Dendryphion nanum TaxID=256645 RepID=A0A9P9E170_9PLEO|nr:NAD(P)-binding protein [Dendryphion nanum]